MRPASWIPPLHLFFPHWLCNTTIRDLSPGEATSLSFAVFAVVLGIAQVSRLWDPKSPVRAWESGETKRTFILLGLFLVYVIATFVRFGTLLHQEKLQIAYPLLLELLWLDGLIVEVCVYPHWQDITHTRSSLHFSAHEGAKYLDCYLWLCLCQWYTPPRGLWHIVPQWEYR